MRTWQLLSCRSALPVGAAVLLLTAGTGVAHGMNNASYWDFADSQAAALDAGWSPESEGYVSSTGPLDSRLNATMLQLHSLAAITGRTGASRRDDRARLIVNRLTAPPAFVSSKKDYESVLGAGTAHFPGWTGNASGSARGEMHMSIDPVIARALATAYRARDQLRLTEPQVSSIRDRISRVAKSRFFSFPTSTLNQWNWAADLWESYATVTGDWTRAASEYRAGLGRFIAGITKRQPGLKSPNLNEGLGFRYAPEVSSKQWPNQSSSTEYGNITFSGLAYYDEMVAHGMTRLSGPDEVLARAWSQRNLEGEWAHSGYVNWDTGLGFLRWHLMRYWAWSMGALLAHASQERLAFDGSERAWATAVLDRSLQLYSRWSGLNSGYLPGYQFSISGKFSSNPADDGLLNSARFAVIGASAAGMDLGRTTPVIPPSWFTYDPDVRRLAVSTPTYSTSLLPPQPGAGSQYGGLEPTRLLDGLARPISGTGGRGLSAFNIQIANKGKTGLQSQPESTLGYAPSKWTLSENRLRGSFDVLDASASLRFAFDSLQVVHRFTPNQIITTRKLKLHAPGDLTISLPIWSGGTARIAGLQLSTAQSGLRNGEAIEISSGEGGSYTASFSGLPSKASVKVVERTRQSSSPRTTSSVLVTFSLPAGTTVPIVQYVTPAPA